MSAPAVDQLAPLERRPDEARINKAPAASRCSVLIATVNRPAGDTGVHTHTRNLLEGLRAAGVRTGVVTPFDGSRKWLPLFAIRPLVLRHLNATWSTQWYRHWHLVALKENLRRALRKATPSHILAQCPLSARAALDVREELGLTRLTLSTVCHFNRSEADEYRDKGELHGDRPYKAITDFERDVLARVDHVIYVSRWAQELVERERGIRTRASSVIWNGVANAACVPLAGGRSVIGLSADDVVLINVGTLEPRKNQLRLLELFATVVQRHPRSKLVLVGDGPQRSDVEAAIERLGLREHVRTLGHRTDVASLMQLADLYVHYATAENCPTVLLEAARAGLAIAAVPVGGIPEILEALGEAATLPPDDHDSSIARLAPFLTSSDLRAAAGRLAREVFNAQFDRERMAGAYADLICRLSATAAPAEGAS